MWSGAGEIFITTAIVGNFNAEISLHQALNKYGSSPLQG